ncbi:MAG: zinc ribbon domain-containing protein [Thaumarchaeota archaeon]|nr:zinc ribbon domain-containing protein [Nitrososphaerota archaeon]
MPDPKFCGKCGFLLPKNVKFCTNCGTKISDLQEDEKESIAKTTKHDFLDNSSNSNQIFIYYNQ